MEVTPLIITKEEFLRIQKKTIGYGTEGKVFKVNRKELIKIYHENIANIIIKAKTTIALVCVFFLVSFILFNSLLSILAGITTAPLTSLPEIKSTNIGATFALIYDINNSCLFCIFKLHYML